MKVIYAGYSKTGTKSMTAALTILGYEVYDAFEQYVYLGDEWMRIMRSDGKPVVEELKRMFKDVDAGSDVPFFYYWEELHQAFPEAKIILTLRDEDSWYKSMRGQLDHSSRNTIFHHMMAMTPSGRKFGRVLKICFNQILGCYWDGPYTWIESNELTMKIRFRQHNEYVMKHAPKDKLLIYSVKDGWGPLCEFLGKEIPDRPFPRKNVGATAIDDAIKENPVMMKMKRELMMVLGLLSGLGVVGTFVAYKRFPWSICKAYFASALSRLMT